MERVESLLECGGCSGEIGEFGTCLEFLCLAVDQIIAASDPLQMELSRGVLNTCYSINQAIG